MRQRILATEAIEAAGIIEGVYTRFLPCPLCELLPDKRCWSW